MDFLLHLTYGDESNVHPETALLPDCRVAQPSKKLTYRMYTEFMLACGCFFVFFAPCTRTKLLVSG
jgi:hypothetical protein